MITFNYINMHLSTIVSENIHRCLNSTYLFDVDWGNRSTYGPVKHFLSDTSQTLNAVTSVKSFTQNRT